MGKLRPGGQIRPIGLFNLPFWPPWICPNYIISVNYLIGRLPSFTLQCLHFPNRWRTPGVRCFTLYFTFSLPFVWNCLKKCVKNPDNEENCLETEKCKRCNDRMNPLKNASVHLKRRWYFVTTQKCHSAVHQLEVEKEKKYFWLFKNLTLRDANDVVPFLICQK